jgi:hypothetical protein
MTDDRSVDTNTGTNSNDKWGRTLMDIQDDISYVSAVDSDDDDDDDDIDDDRSTRTLSNIRNDIKVCRH